MTERKGKPDVIDAATKRGFARWLGWRDAGRPSTRGWMAGWRRALWFALATWLPSAWLAAPPAAAERPESLPSLCIDEKAVSVSGISSGAFFAHQFHVAHSARVMGAAIFAGGPYLCAGRNFPKSVFRFVNVCSNTGSGSFLGPPEARRSIAAARAAASAGAIDDTTGMRGDRVLLFSGRLDALVPLSVTESVRTFYRAFDDEENLAFVSDVEAGHAMVTEAFGNPCTTSEAPFVNACGFDLAGAALTHIYRSLRPPEAAAGALLAFVQAEFAEAERHGFSPTGYLYVPRSCAGGGCRLHIAFHGCLQNVDTVGDAFVRHAGYNEWAEANGIVILYPQAAAVDLPIAGRRVGWPNPKGCWDWWGFTGRDFARKSGPQIRAIDGMIDRLAGRGTGGSSAPPSSRTRTCGE